jgi:hypothetical protein
MRMRRRASGGDFDAKCSGCGRRQYSAVNILMANAAMGRPAMAGAEQVGHGSFRARGVVSDAHQDWPELVVGTAAGLEAGGAENTSAGAVAALEVSS